MRSVRKSCPPFFLFALTLLSILLSFCAVAQKADVRIRVQNSKQEPLPFAGVTVINRADTVQRLSAIADSTGGTLFDLDTPGLYTVNVTALDYQPLSRIIMVTGKDFAFDMAMEPAGTSLNEVVIQAAKPLMRQEDDKTIIDPESLAAASTNGYEVLEKTPGIFVDQDGNIYLSSTTPATIYINGREMKMSRSDIATMLKSLPPNAIEKIEILRTPSARYDATGSGGVVNVVLRKGVKIGLTGSITGGFQQGKYGNQFGGINLSNNNGATSAYVNLNYNKSNKYEVLNTDRVIREDTILSQEAYTTYPGSTYYMAYGISHDFTDKWNAGYDGRLSYNNSDNKTENRNSFVTAANDEVLGSSLAHLDNDGGTFFLNQDLSAKYKIDTAGSEWTSGLSYTYSSSRTGQQFETQSLIPYGGDGRVESKRHYLSFQSDLTYKFPHAITIESGIKSAYLTFRNDADYYLSLNGVRAQDGSRTNAYRYRELINAAYLQASKGFGGFLLKAGVRMENTNMDGQQFVPGDTSFSIRRTDFFPYVYFSRKIMSIAKYDLRAYLVYRRTISRPSYEQLNPFPKYVDQFLSEVGNPALRPQFTHNYEANISVDERPLFAVGFNDAQDMFTNVYYQADSSTAQAYRTYDNIGRNKEFYLRGLGAIPPGGVYFFVLGAQYNHNVYNGVYEGRPLSFSGDSWLFFTYHQLKLDKHSQVTLHGFMRLKGPLQFYELSSFGSLSLNINRKFFDQKLTVTLSFNDLFFTNNNRFTINQASVNATGYRESDSRRFGINLRYNFGFRKKDEERDMFNMQPDKLN